MITYLPVGLVRWRPAGRLAMRTAMPIVDLRVLAGAVAVWLLALFFTRRRRELPSRSRRAACAFRGAPGHAVPDITRLPRVPQRLTTPTGEDVSIGVSWRASMMANSSRDPYWQAAVRRETIDHPSAAREIEEECSICHMPMSRTKARAAAQPGRIFAHLPIGAGALRRRPARRRRRVVHGLPSDRTRAPRDARELHRRLRHQRSDRLPASAGCSGRSKSMPAEPA